MKQEWKPVPAFRLLLAALALSVCLVAAAGEPRGPRGYVSKPDAWFETASARQAIENVLSYQSEHGSWPKNIDTTARRYEGDPEQLKGTFDNGATTGEMRFLARAFKATRDARCERAFLRGLDGVLKGQYPSGGWPQYYPPPASAYPRHITFNDRAMVRLLELLREVAAGSGDYDFVPASQRQAARGSVAKGIQCIVDCQVRVEGTLTVWCAQHDEKTLEPRAGRSYELPSLSGAESAETLRFLMSLESPSPAVIRAVESGVKWFESVKLTAIRQVRVDGNKVIVKDPAAPPLWARFYEIGSNRPIFSGRDGVKKYDIAEIEPERRNGYAWYGAWGEGLTQECSRWKERQTTQETREATK